jgi:hypothetical protein
MLQLRLLPPTDGARSRELQLGPQAHYLGGDQGPLHLALHRAKTGEQDRREQKQNDGDDQQFETYRPRRPMISA